MEEFECLLGESPTNFPKGVGIENMESELHSASIDTEVYEQQTVERVMQEAEHSSKLPTNKVFLLILLICQSFI